MKPENLWGSNPNENFFRKTVHLMHAPKTAYARIYVDTGYELFINGRYVARVDEWCNTRDYNVRLFLNAGENLIAVHALNHGGHRGLAFELAVDGESVLATDGAWKTAPHEEWGWMLNDFNDSAWAQATVLDMSAAGSPQWWTKPGSDPERIVPTLDCSQFFLGDIPKTCASPYWTARPDGWKPDPAVTKLVGEDYAAFAQAAHLPAIHKYQALLQNTAEALEDGRVLIRETQRYTGPSFIVDMGGETVGFFRMKLESAKALSYRLYYGETLDEAMSEPSRDQDLNKMLREEYRVFGGVQEVESRMRVAFRYVRVEFYDAAAPVTASDFAVRTTLYPVSRRGYFACDDADLTKVWQMGERTQHFCMQEYYLDAPKRDRFMWTGDTRMQALVNYYTFADTKLFEFCWDELARTQYPSGGISSAYGEGCSMLWDYTAWYVIAYYDEYMYSGCADFALKNINSIEKCVDYLMSLADESGLINVPKNPLGRLWMVVLNTFVGYDPFLNELYLRCLKAASLFVGMVSEERAARYRLAAGKVEPKVNALLADDAMVRHFDETPHTTLQYELAEMALNDGKIDDMLARIRKYWVCMISSGSDCLHEGTSSTGKLNRIDAHNTDHPGFGSYCHAWTAAATVLLPMGVAGIRPVEPGFKRVRIAPKMGDLKAVRCVVPAPQGEIAVRIENGEIAYHLPAGVEGELVLEDRTLRISGDGCEKL